ncbi:MAG: glycoside hydrolase family 3 protein, partial [Proteobacteria bacterium]|nr:glycoside hydrolase family 3 protein [Pseudomonadota bacterium]
MKLSSILLISTSLLLFLPSILPSANSPAISYKAKVAKNTGYDNKGLDFKIGQMLMVGFRGFRVGDSHPIAIDIRKHHLGGVVLYDRDIRGKKLQLNIESPKQLKALTRDLQGLSDTALFIAIDYEGGVISRLKLEYGFPATISHRQLGKTGDTALTYKEAGKMAKQLKSLGINLNLAPVVDLNTNPKNPVIGKLGRSFSENPDIVSNHALAYINASRENGIITTLKHFPGHGSSDTDSHLGFTDVTQKWSPAELEPFRQIVRKGKADAVMTAHVFNWRIDPDYPATLSKKTISGLLRENLQYKGVVISDDLQMKAIADNYGLEEAVIKSIEAGIDIMIFSKNTDEEGKSLVKKVKSIILGAIA